MLNPLALAAAAFATAAAHASPTLAWSLGANMPDGFVTNRQLIIGFAVALVLAFFAKLALRSHDERQATKREEKQELAAISRSGPPTFNG